VFNVLLTVALITFSFTDTTMALVPVSVSFLFIHAVVVLIVLNEPGTKFYQPLRKLLPSLGFLVSMVAAIFFMIQFHVGLLIFYGGLTLLLGDAVVSTIETLRMRKTPVVFVTACGYLLFIIGNACFVFSVDNFSEFGLSLLLCGSMFLLLGNGLVIAQRVIEPQNNIPVTFVPQSLSFEEQSIDNEF
jgi:hypothetical protein